MKLQRFILEFNAEGERFIIDDLDFLNQVRNVFRLGVGDRVVLGDGHLNEVVAQIVGFSKRGVELERVSAGKNSNEPARRVALYCSLLKRENFEWVVQKATEVGVVEIVPLITRRTVKMHSNQARLEKIIKEAAEQSGRGIVPTLHAPAHFAEAVKAAQGANFFFDGAGSILASGFKVRDLRIWIGPEGGWDEGEITLAKNAGFTVVGLGALTLRAETAAVVASYLALHS